MPTNVRDPRSIITPHAFGISKELLGTPLAGPWRRFWALLVDLMVVGLLTVFLESIQLLVWGVVGLFFLRAAFVRTGRTGQTVAVLLRTSAGCLGGVILVAVLIAWMAARLGSDGPRTPGTPGVDVPGLAGGGGNMEELARGLAGLALAREMDRAATEQVARAVAADVLREHRDIFGREMDDEELLDLLDELTPDDASWEDRDTEIYREAIAAWRAEAGGAAGGGGAGDDPVGQAASPGAGDATGPDSAEVAAVLDRVAALTPGEAMAAFASLTDDGPLPDTGLAGVRAAALRRRLAGDVAGDTLTALEDSLDAASRSAARLRRDIEETREELAEEADSFANLLRDVWEQLGSAIGLWSIYFTVLLTLWKGRTVGKRLMGVRVVRLDAEPITWWSAFERAGGYVAGLATGLLGFLQVFWDPNRQCIHDKIVGTVVVLEGGQPVPGAWQEASGTFVEDDEERT